MRGSSVENVGVAGMKGEGDDRLKTLILNGGDAAPVGSSVFGKVDAVVGSRGDDIGVGGGDRQGPDWLAFQAGKEGPGMTGISGFIDAGFPGFVRLHAYIPRRSIDFQGMQGPG